MTEGRRVKERKRYKKLNERKIEKGEREENRKRGKGEKEREISGKFEREKKQVKR